jgi:hypothetical protein
LAIKNWKVVVSSLGGKEQLAQVAVEANNWIDAVRTARQKLGENGVVPPGSSCAVAPDGVVTVLDPLSQRKFVLRPESAATVPAEKDAAQSPAKRESEQQLPVVASPAAKPVEKANRSGNDAVTSKDRDEETAKHRKFHTVAYQPQVHLPNAAKEVLIGDRRASDDRKSVRPDAERSGINDTKASDESFPEQPVMNSTTATAQRRASSEEKQEPSTRKRDSYAPGVHRDWLRLILARNEDPSADNPLVYRERCYLVPKSLGLSEIEAALREQLGIIERELAGVSTGKFVNLAAFDHVWNDKPERPPLIILQWKDWRSEVCVEFPASARESKNTSGRPVSYDEDKLTKVFEALHNLTFLGNAAEGMEFVINLLQDAIACEAASGCIYDINTHELRFVVASGSGGEERKGRGIPLDKGLLGYSARQDETTKLFTNLENNPYFDQEIDARIGLTAKSMLLRPLVQDSHLLGMIQLINRKDLPEFTAEDSSLVTYVAKQLTEFIGRSRLRHGKK